MGVKTYSDNSAKTKYSFKRKAGRSLIYRTPVFSPDGESLLVIVEDVVRVYNLQTRDCARILETDTPVKELVGIEFPDDENYNLYGCSNDGRIITWTWDSGAVLREPTLQIPSDLSIQTFNVINSNECFITAAKPGLKFMFLGLFSMKTGQLIHHFSESYPRYIEGMVRTAIGTYNGDRFAVVVNGTCVMSILNLRQQHIRDSVMNSNEVRILSVATHKTENAVAITDALGRVTIYRGNIFYTHGSDCAKEILHWHYLPLMSVCFSTQGSYLYSGGLEQTLVKWSLGAVAARAQERLFLPRLPAAVRHVAADTRHVAVALKNNCIVIANPQLRTVGTILECGGVSPLARALGPPLLPHPRLGGLLLGGPTGHLQLYSTQTDKMLYNIDITGMNPIPARRSDLTPVETEVTCAAASENGSWLATSEYRNDGNTYPEERLKFWMIQPKKTSPFTLNTCVNLSHGGCRVVALAFNHRGEFCVSAGGDQKFRIWRRANTSQRHRKAESWSCLTACYYNSGIARYMAHGILNDYKNMEVPPNDAVPPYVRECPKKEDVLQKLMNSHKEGGLKPGGEIDAGFSLSAHDMGGVAISADGSLVAAWFGRRMTLWDTHLCSLRTALAHPALRPRGLHVHFGHKDAGHYVVCTTANCLAVWSLLSLTVKWLVPISVSCLAADPFSNRMALVTTNNDVFVFTPHSARPVATLRGAVPAAGGRVTRAAFGGAEGGAAGAEGGGRLYLVRNNSEIYSLESEGPTPRAEALPPHHAPAPAGLRALLAERASSGVVGVPRTDVVADTAPAADGAFIQFLSGAPHMIPPVSLLCTPFLHHLVGHEDPPSDPEDDPVPPEEDPPSDDDHTPRPPGGPYTRPLLAPNYEKVKEKRLQKIVSEQLLDLHEVSDVFGV